MRMLPELVRVLGEDSLIQPDNLLLRLIVAQDGKTKRWASVSSPGNNNSLLVSLDGGIRPRAAL